MKMWRRILRPMLLVILSSSLLGQSVFAQFSSSTAARTTTGATSGAGGGSTSGFGTGATGAGGAGAGATSGGMFGNTQGGANVFGQGLNAQSRQVNAQSQLGINPSQFLGQGNNQQNFLGRNQRTQTQNNGNRQQQQNNRQGGAGQNDQNNMNQSQQNQDQRRAIRPSFKVAFDQPQKPAADIRSTLQPRFDSLSQTPSLRGVAYELDQDGVVVLRGTVETPAQQRLAENVLKLEPGVKKVRNELTLNEPAPKP